MIDRYSLSTLITKATVTSLSYGALHLAGQAQTTGFVVESTAPDGTVTRRGASRVVIAVGSHSVPNIPTAIRNSVSGEEGDGWCHSSALARPGFRFPSKVLRAAIRARRSTTMVVIGGGYVMLS